MQGLQSPSNHTGPTKNLRDPSPRLLSYVTAPQQTFLLCNAAPAKVRQGGAEIFCRSGRAGDDVVDRKRFVRKQKQESLLTLQSLARGTGKKIGYPPPKATRSGRLRGVRAALPNRSGAVRRCGHCRTVSATIESGLELAFYREANLPAYSLPPPKAALCF